MKMNERAWDLLYLKTRENVDNASGAIMAAFPTARLEEHWDDTREWQLQVTLEDVSRDDWAVWALKEGIGAMSFDIQMTLYQDPQRLKGWLEKIGISVGNDGEEE